MKYIATREGVEHIQKDGPVTERQKKLVHHLLRDFPETESLWEYQDYHTAPSAQTASAFISMALDSNIQEVGSRDLYMRYIATRPRVEKLGSHGLFSAAPSVDLNAALAELEQHEGTVWTIIYSLRREDAARLEYDNADAWRTLLMHHQQDMARIMNIPLQNFRWYAAFHDESYHPHVHMMIWSTVSGQGHVNSKGATALRSKLTNVIFKDDLHALYVKKDSAYKELTRASQDTMEELIRKMVNGLCADPVIEHKMAELMVQLEHTTGKKKYGYLKRPLKHLVDEIVDALAKHPEVSACYDKWNQLRDELEHFYHEQEPRKHQPLSQQKEFHSIKNIVIQEAEALRLGKFTFEDERMPDEPERPPGHMSRTRYDQQSRCRSAAEILENSALTAEEKESALHTLEHLWAEGFSPAAYHLGRFFRDDTGIKYDPETSRLWFRRGAEAGDDRSEYALGKSLLTAGRIEDAMYWFGRAGAHGNEFALYQLGKLYLTGDCVPKNLEAALDCLTRSAEQGNQFAQYTLGKLFLFGRDMEKDPARAEYWLTQAADQGNQYAQFFLEHLHEKRDLSLLLSSTRLLHHMGQIFRDNSAPPANPAGIRIESKRRKRLLEKRMAMGHKADDHEDHIQSQPTM